MKLRLLLILLGGFAAPAASAQPAALYGVGDFVDRQGRSVGRLSLLQTPHGVLLQADVSGLQHGEHAFHVHATGRCDPADGFRSAGDHFAPRAASHGFGTAKGPHAGDMPNQVAGTDGWLFARVLNPRITLRRGETESVFDHDGAAVVLHAQPDDYGSQPSGAAGDRIACAVIRGAPALRTAQASTPSEPPGGRLQRDGWSGVAPGIAIEDSEGRLIGEFEAWGRSSTAPMAILQVDGMLVGVPRDTLRVAGGRIISLQSQAEILEAAGAPR